MSSPSLSRNPSSYPCKVLMGLANISLELCFLFSCISNCLSGLDRDASEMDGYCGYSMVHSNYPNIFTIILVKCYLRIFTSGNHLQKILQKGSFILVPQFVALSSYVGQATFPLLNHVCTSVKNNLVISVSISVSLFSSAGLSLQSFNNIIDYFSYIVSLTTRKINSPTSSCFSKLF